jgi:hypothetical protein
VRAARGWEKLTLASWVTELLGEKPWGKRMRQRGSGGKLHNVHGKIHNGNEYSCFGVLLGNYLDFGLTTPDMEKFGSDRMNGWRGMAFR